MVSSQGAGTAASGQKDPDAIVPVEEIDLVGGNPSLDFVNTGAGRRIGPFRDKLKAYGDLVTWAERVVELDRETGDRLRRLAASDPAGAERVLARGRELREAIYRSLSAIARGESASAADLEVVGAAVARASAHRRLVPTPDGCEYEYTDDEALERPLWPVALSAADLATSGEVARVKECASENCNWLFLDVSKNRSRRWCDMKDCGNRAKARRHRAKSRVS